MESLVSLAFSMHSNPGIYALLVGSGLSRAAGIPTGWEIVIDLLRKLAVLHGEDPSGDVEAWYDATYKKAPDYSDLLDELGKTAEERRQILRAYFEPTESEREEGLKTPTAAHRAIAELIKAGFIRVVLTTNFDRLLETALIDLGIQPVVISTADATRGALPLTHQKIVIVKINGDYLDSRIKNTVPELDHYEKELDAFLDRLFDEFGLIVCGWSADWDAALRRAVERCPTRRFSTFWCARGIPTGKANDLINLRAAQTIPVASADLFFSSLQEKVSALTEFSRQHPMSAKIAGVQVKRYVVRPEERIRLYDLVHGEIERAYNAMNPAVFHANQVPDAAVELEKRLKAYHDISEVLLSIVATGCFWGEPEHSYLWRGLITRLGNPPGTQSGLVAWIRLRLYPAMLLMYAGGIAALNAGRGHNLAAILKATLQSTDVRGGEIAAYNLSVGYVMPDNLYKFIPGVPNRRTPLSDYLLDALKGVLAEFVWPDQDYSLSFSMFEYLAGVTAFSNKNNGTFYLLIGRARWADKQLFTASGRSAPSNPHIAAVVVPHLFPSLDDYAKAKAEYDAWAARNTSSW